MSNPQTVLIVDDSDSIRFALRTLLTCEGYVTLEAADGVEAVDTLLLSLVRLIVLLDLMMPRMTGLDVLDLMDTRCEELTRHVYIVMTADKRALDADHNAILTRHDIPLMEKPFDVGKLVREVARAVSRLS